MSKLFFKTYREPPQDAEAESHKLLIRAGYIQRVASGIYSYLPLGYRVLQKISNIIRQELDSAGCQELLLPALTPYEFWQESGRDQFFGELLPAFVIKARAGQYVLGPTHEEVITKLVTNVIDSYKSLGVCLYQIQNKFRDEARPRFGLIRTKELIMADAYSFDINKENMNATYWDMVKCYETIFTRLGLNAIKVQASSGAIGGDINHEFMVEASIGEDFFLKCNKCGTALNIEAYSLADAPNSFQEFEINKEPQLLDTPNTTSIKDLQTLLLKDFPELKEDHFLKTIAVKKDNKIYLLLLAGNRELKPDLEFEFLSEQDFQNHPDLIKGYLGPCGLDKTYEIIADFSIKNTPKHGWITGANTDGKHIAGIFPGRDFQIASWQQLSKPIDKDPCPNCGAPLKIIRSVEVGHTFQLGLTYSSKIKGATFLNSKGTQEPYWMGCYGIGVSRLVAVIAEKFHDDLGLALPVSVAPYQVHLIAIDYQKNDQVTQATEQFYKKLTDQGIEVLFDDRGLSAGIALNDADLIGIPFRIIIGPRSVREGKAEIVLRANIQLQAQLTKIFGDQNSIKIDLLAPGSEIKELLML